MTTPIVKEVTLIFRNGYQCTHYPHVKSEEEWWKLVKQIDDALAHRHKSASLTLSRPYGLHRVDDIIAIHYGDEQPPDDTSPIGFLGSR